MQRRADRFHTPVRFRSTRYSGIAARENPSRLADDLIDPTRPACLPEDGEGWNEPVERDKRSRAELKDARSGESHLARIPRAVPIASRAAKRKKRRASQAKTASWRSCGPGGA